jgi:hypothetical protein
MPASAEFGVCGVCGKDNYLIRTYFTYDIKCECHSGNHFEIISHCNTCIPVDPKTTIMTIKTENLKLLNQT